MAYHSMHEMHQENIEANACHLVGEEPDIGLHDVNSIQTIDPVGK